MKNIWVQISGLENLWKLFFRNFSHNFGHQRNDKTFLEKCKELWILDLKPYIWILFLFQSNTYLAPFPFAMFRMLRSNAKAHHGFTIYPIGESCMGAKIELLLLNRYIAQNKIDILMPSTNPIWNTLFSQTWQKLM